MTTESDDEVLSERLNGRIRANAAARRHGVKVDERKRQPHQEEEEIDEDATDDDEETEEDEEDSQDGGRKGNGTRYKVQLVDEFEEGIEQCIKVVTKEELRYVIIGMMPLAPTFSGLMN
jgi:hypothetical protein